MKRILVTGATGLVGKAVLRCVPEDLKEGVVGISTKEVDLRDYNMVKAAMEYLQPDVVIHLAAKVGGVKANGDFLADFYTDNIQINTNVLKAAHESNVQNVVSLLSTCVYPRNEFVEYPLTEDQLHLGPPHESNYGYAYAKRMLEVQSRAYRDQFSRDYVCAIPNNIYGPHDNFNLIQGHVVPAVIRKIYEAKAHGVPPTFWGEGTSLREFTYVDDVAICLLKMAGVVECQDEDLKLCNIGLNNEVSIKTLVEMVATALDYSSDEIIWDTTKPNGQHRKPSLASQITHTYKPLEEGLRLTCEWFVENYPDVRGITDDSITARFA